MHACVSVCVRMIGFNMLKWENRYPKSPFSLMKGNNESLGLFFFFASPWVRVYFCFIVSFSSNRPWLNLVFFHHIHYWHISCRGAAVVPERLTLGQSGGACLIRKTIRMESAQQSLVMQPGAKSHCTVNLLAGCHCCCTYKPSDLAQYLIPSKTINGPLQATGQFTDNKPTLGLQCVLVTSPSLICSPYISHSVTIEKVSSTTAFLPV